MQRTRFTKRELDLILDMVMIAGFGPESDGDYQEWTVVDYRALKRLRDKLWDRLASFKSSGHFDSNHNEN
jgi:hypothetical protein